MGRMDSCSWKTKSMQIMNTGDTGRICKTTVPPSFLPQVVICSHTESVDQPGISANVATYRTGLRQILDRRVVCSWVLRFFKGVFSRAIHRCERFKNKFERLAHTADQALAQVILKIGPQRNAQCHRRSRVASRLGSILSSKSQLLTVGSKTTPNPYWFR
jgi:hypothetical protein